MGEFALVTMIPPLFYRFRGFNASDQTNTQGDRKAFTYVNEALSKGMCRIKLSKTASCKET